jgi:hypothetical protein
MEPREKRDVIMENGQLLYTVNEDSFLHPRFAFPKLENDIGIMPLMDTCNYEKIYI